MKIGVLAYFEKISVRKDFAWRRIKPQIIFFKLSSLFIKEKYCITEFEASRIHIAGISHNES